MGFRLRYVVHAWSIEFFCKLPSTCHLAGQRMLAVLSLQKTVDSALYMFACSVEIYALL